MGPALRQQPDPWPRKENLPWRTRRYRVNIDSIHDQVHTAVRELCSAAVRIRLVAAALESSVEELISHAPAEHLLQAGAVAKAHASGVLQSIMEVAAKADRWKQSPPFARPWIRKTIARLGLEHDEPVVPCTRAGKGSR
jgi:hypothetical protein